MPERIVELRELKKKKYNPGQRDGGGWGWGWRGMKREHTHTQKKKRSDIEALRAKNCREGRERTLLPL